MSAATRTDLIFPSPDGSPWNTDRARNGRKRTFAEAARAAGVPNARPYDLRQSFVSVLIAQGATVIDVASQPGHAPTMTRDTYAHVFNDLAGGERTSAENLIRSARTRILSSDVSVLCPRGDDPIAANSENPCKSIRYRTARIATGKWRKFSVTIVRTSSSATAAAST